MKRKKLDSQSETEESKDWNWDWLLFMHTNLLKLPEESFWKSTPKKSQLLFEQYKKFNGIVSEKEKEANIEDVLF